MNLLQANQIKYNHVIRLLMVDHQQNNFNHIQLALKDAGYQSQGKLLDDLSSFEKMINLQWDAIVFHHAYDFSYEQAIKMLREKQKNVPVLLLSTIDVRSPEALDVYKLGVFSILHPENYDYISIMLVRAAVFTRILRQKQKLSDEVDKLQQQSQSLVKNTDYAVAVFHEGVHVSVNQQYITLFGQQSADDFIGLPIMDVLCPQDTSQFKKAYKRFAAGDFSESPITIDTTNSQCQEKKLKLQFSHINFENENDLQLIVLTDNINHDLEHQSKSMHDEQSLLHRDSNFFPYIQTLLSTNQNICLVFFVLNDLPESLFKLEWNAPGQFFVSLQQQLNKLSPHALYHIAEHIFVLCISNPNHEAVQKYLDQIQPHLPKSIQVNQHQFAISIRLTSTTINQRISESQLNQYINQALQQSEVTNHSDTPLIDSQISESALGAHPTESETTTAVSEFINETTEQPSSSLMIDENGDTTLVRSLEQQLQQNQIQLRYQQIYDKEDIDTHLYEVSAYFRHGENTINFKGCDELFRQNPAIAIKAHRWVLVEACKHLHNFLPQRPKAKIIVSLHSICFNDQDLINLFAKLVSLINSKYTHPLILHLKESDIVLCMEDTLKFCQKVRDQGIDLAIEDFGTTEFSKVILPRLGIQYAQLNTKYSQLLLTDDGLVELQERLDDFRTHMPDVKFLIGELNDMTIFANAWNVDIRYLQGNYFQAKQSEFVDSAS
ncbi:EAL domain-containing protein [Acinetobacter qingfengensis]|uniref:EAL domain-containing protein n=1 Tax=Acinetobacter qingfengensis TaxID=1262585 RepID=A0A1E7R9D3_9GAMM|nr:EAL domain-containing protein [Acinetobacter qingfengensis]KAA8735511.1 EAL domain-containing protein [Acinetobacter qingfengensis]OEY95843.1 hypothetical protein BJI46_02695 [Acinetobacter qingfengensis]